MVEREDASQIFSDRLDDWMARHERALQTLSERVDAWLEASTPNAALFEEYSSSKQDAEYSSSKPDAETDRQDDLVAPARKDDWAHGLLESMPPAPTGSPPPLEQCLSQQHAPQERTPSERFAARGSMSGPTTFPVQSLEHQEFEARRAADAPHSYKKQVSGHSLDTQCSEDLRLADARRASRDIVPEPGESEEEEKTSRCRQVLQDLLASKYFDMLICGLILSNTILVGCQVQYAADHPADSLPRYWSDVQNAYSAVFACELLLRVSAEGVSFLSPASDSFAWNMFDAAVVLASGLELIFTEVTPQGTSMPNFIYMRVLRVARIMTKFTRLMRLVRLTRIFRPLRIMLHSIVHTSKSIFWVVLLLLLFQYIFAILFTTATVDYFVEHGGSDCGGVLPLCSTRQQAADCCATLDLQRLYGSLPNAMLTLYKSSTGGLDWHESVSPLMHTDNLYVWLFLLYQFFTHFALLNVVTGVFCHSAIESAQQDQEMVVEAQIQKMEADSQQIAGLFRRIDADHNGVLTLEELEMHLQDEAVVAFLASMDIQPRDAWSFFKMMDVHKKHSLTATEFVKSCLRLKGQAKTHDIYEMRLETMGTLQKVYDVAKQIRRQSRPRDQREGKVLGMSFLPPSTGCASRALASLPIAAKNAGGVDFRAQAPSPSATQAKEDLLQMSL